MNVAQDASELIVEREGPVTRLQLNRPARGNALSAGLVLNLRDAVADAARDGTRLLVLTGGGASFCSGFDLGGLDRQSDGDLALRFLQAEEMLQAVHHFPGETLALAHGRVFGAGADLFGACARRIAAPGTTFRFPGVRFGVVLGTRRLGAIVGLQAARRLILDGIELDADTAIANGFASEIAAPAAWPERQSAIFANLGLLAPQTHEAISRCLRPDTRAQDMADLAASVARPGLKQRIETYKSAIGNRS
ncbi:enoyl-CoA hydratase/isomerase family protein [Xanthobacter tagetidis]|jgi:enoyl-CoA hydratase/carnithine racemase|uniref:Enoyl-CoA hydratase/isomerase family protein n=1 Tax=Xanthobacter tagetidis TaxID=60216 RepID=A0A3L7A461_9HYPH|nr:enoyl-CoA hydratase/isomerase family protein [Xanthobacter tagetidis]MBB6308845.1 enoyl-CoA hydratase/carnithine racemase [Xanthobacter tagetidis]RLP74894.1 enoyl-CoA hydratase/isomerase family protein [Xanthobacter tagetidis]